MNRVLAAGLAAGLVVSLGAPSAPARVSSGSATAGGCVELEVDAVVVSDPVRGNRAPKPIPGAVIGVTVTARNACARDVDRGSLVVTVPLPEGCRLHVPASGSAVRRVVADASVTLPAASAPVPSGDLLTFSCDGGRSFQCRPRPGSHSALVSHVRIRPRELLPGRTAAGPGHLSWYYELVIEDGTVTTGS